MCKGRPSAENETNGLCTTPRGVHKRLDAMRRSDFPVSVLLAIGRHFGTVIGPAFRPAIGNPFRLSISKKAVINKKDADIRLFVVECIDCYRRLGCVVDAEIANRHRRLARRLVEANQIDVHPPVSRIDFERTFEMFVVALPHRRRQHVRTAAVAFFEPEHTPQPFVAVERIDAVVQFDRVGARACIQCDAHARSIAQRPYPDERIGMQPPCLRPFGYVVDSVQYGDFAVVVLSFAFEQHDGLLDDIAQTSTLALREVADGVLHVGHSVTVTGENRLVYLQRIQLSLALDIGIDEKRIVENERQLVVGDDRVAFAGSGREREECDEKRT